MRKLLLSMLIAVSINGWTPALAFAVPLIDTTGATFDSVIRPFGEPNTSAYGQTFTVTGPETVLTGFSFRFLQDTTNPIDFAAYVYAWDGVKASGPQLYASAERSSTNNGGAGGYEVFDFSTGNLMLVSGQQYVAFLSTALFFDGIPASSTWSTVGGLYYSGGMFVAHNAGSNFAALLTSPWNLRSNSRDTWFKAAFTTPIPEPGTGLLVLGGLLGLAGGRRRLRA